MENRQNLWLARRCLFFLYVHYPFVLLSVGAVTILTFSGSILLSNQVENRTFDELLLEDGRNYKQAPFDMLDATRYCQLKTQVRYGESLSLSYVDENSTRIDQDTGVYKVFMVAFIGSELSKEEKAVHCFVDPVERVVTHYRSWDRYQTSLVSKAIRFFQ